MSEHVQYTIKEIQNCLNDITHSMHLDRYLPDVIVGIARGGLLPALYLSHYFDVSLLTVSISFRDQKTFFDNDIVSNISDLLKQGKKVCLVDDICDSGKTLYVLWNSLSNISGFEDNLKSAVLIHNEAETMFSPSYKGVIINKETDPRWIIFPWENWWTL